MKLGKMLTPTVLLRFVYKYFAKAAVKTSKLIPYSFMDITPNIFMKLLNKLMDFFVKFIA